MAYEGTIVDSVNLTVLIQRHPSEGAREMEIITYRLAEARRGIDDSIRGYSLAALLFFVTQ